MQGFGIDTKTDEAGTLLELELKIVSNDECYDKLKEALNKVPALKTSIEQSVFDGINEGVLCTLTKCNLTAELSRENQDDEGLTRKSKCVR